MKGELTPIAMARRIAHRSRRFVIRTPSQTQAAAKATPITGRAMLIPAILHAGRQGREWLLCSGSGTFSVPTAGSVQRGNCSKCGYSSAAHFLDRNFLSIALAGANTCPQNSGEPGTAGFLASVHFKFAAPHRHDVHAGATNWLDHPEIRTDIEARGRNANDSGCRDGREFVGIAVHPSIVPRTRGSQQRNVPQPQAAIPSPASPRVRCQNQRTTNRRSRRMSDQSTARPLFRKIATGMSIVCFLLAGWAAIFVDEEIRFIAAGVCLFVGFVMLVIGVKGRWPPGRS